MSAIGNTGSAANIRADYMNLLITQLQNQNPLEPMDNNQMSAQLTQLSQLEQLEEMKGSFEDLLSAEQNSQTYSLIGKVIGFFPEGGMDAVAGTVQGVEIAGDQAKLVVGEYRVAMEDVLAISEPDTAQ